MRILVAVKPLMYREVVALSLHQHRPDAEVMLSPPEVLAQEIGRFRPHLVVYTEGIAPDTLLDALVYRAKLLFSDGLDAEFSVDGHAKEKKDADMADLLAFVDRAEKTILEEVAD